MRRMGLSIMVLAVFGLGLTACGGGDRWCELDATDQVVADSYCEKNTPGYEWEDDSSSSHSTKTKKKKKR
ncbi:hypothetical protein [Actinocorallia aurea]